MRQLLLLRHAEAQAAHSEAADFERTLSSHGRRQAEAVAQHLQTAGRRPTLLLVSPSLRTRETAAIVLEGLGSAAVIQTEPELYLGEPQTLLAVLRRCPESAQVVMMIGHNPALSSFARELMSAVFDASSPLPAGWQLGTAGLCRLQLDAAPWAQLAAKHIRSVDLGS